jgi:hypothetical protein
MDRDRAAARIDRDGDWIEAGCPCCLDRPLHVAFLELMRSVGIEKLSCEVNRLAFAGLPHATGEN